MAPPSYDEFPVSVHWFTVTVPMVPMAPPKLTAELPASVHWFSDTVARL